MVNLETQGQVKSPQMKEMQTPKTVKGPKEHYLLGQNRMCEFLSSYKTTAK